MELAETIGMLAGIAVGVIVIEGVLILIIRWWWQGAKYKGKNVRIDNKVVIVTGCNTGIGKATVLDLARRGAKIYMACRDMDKCNKARIKIIEKSGNRNIYGMQLDLASFQSIRNFVEEFKKKETRLDILINNAGVMAMPKALTTDGFEMQLGVNHLGHFLLTNLLLDLLKQSAPSRVVAVSCSAHSRGNISRDDFNWEKSYDKWQSYGQSKLANILFIRELSKRLRGTGVTANSLHPGVVKTELNRYRAKNLLIYASYLVIKTPTAGSQTTIKLAVDPLLSDVSGKYYAECKETKPKRNAEDDETALWLWNKSEELTKLIDV